MQFEIITFETRDGLELFGGLQESRKSDTAIIHVHGMTDHFFEGNVMTVMSKTAKSLGMGFLSFNNRGAELVTLINNDFYGTSQEQFEDCILDLEAAIQAMKKRGYTKIILSGHSTGCQKVAYYLNKHSEKPKAVKSSLIQAAIFLAPCDDVNFQKKLLGKKKFKESLSHAQDMIKKRLGKFPIPEKYSSPMFSALRYHALYSGKSIEGHIFNYEENLECVKKIKIPFIAIFCSDEQYAAIPPEKMLEKIAAVKQNQKSKIALIPKGDHSFHGQELALGKVAKKFLTTL
ncbi:MAG: DUF1749 domain-containing protein [Patescibacteria group bacterium]